MKYLYLIFLSFALVSCSNGAKEVYWCGDHACINKKERKIYFAETMIVEVRKLDKNFEIKKPKHASFRQGDVRHSLADINKAKTLLGYEPQIRVSEGIIKTVNRHLMTTT